MNVKRVSLALLVLALALAGYAVWGRQVGLPLAAGAAELRRQEVVSPQDPDLAAVSESGHDSPRTAATRPPAGSSPAGSPTAVAPADQIGLHVVARTPFGDALPGVLLQSVMGGEVTEASIVSDLGRTDARGMLDVAVPRGHLLIRVSDPELVNVIEGVSSPFAAETVSTIVIAGYTRVVTGTVIDPAGAPLAGARVTLICNEDFSARLGEAVGMRNAHLRSVAADDDGAFEFTMAPESPESMVKVEAVGFEYLLKGLPDHGDANIVLRLVPTDPGVTSLRGRVVCADGTSADGAWVAMSPTGMSVRVEDATGVFEIKIGGGETSIHAVLPGFLPARTEKTPGGAWPEELVLVLGSPALEIRGRVVDETGAPFAGLRVGVLDGSGFGAIIEPGSGEGKMKRVEDMASSGGIASCTTSDEGAFRIDGLQPRMYRVLAFDPDQLFGATLSVQAGQIGVEIVIDRHAGTGTVQGRVTDQQGVPLPGVNVRVARTFGIEDHYNREPNGLAGASVATGPEGRFAFPLLALQDAELSAYGGLDFQYLRVPLSNFEDPDELEIKLTRNVHFRIEWAQGMPPRGARSMGLEGPDGSSVRMYRRYEGGVIVLGEVSLEGASTPVLYAGEGRYEVVLFGEDGEVERFPLDLKGTETQTVRR